MLPPPFLSLSLSLSLSFVVQSEALSEAATEETALHASEADLDYYDEDDEMLMEDGLPVPMPGRVDAPLYDNAMMYGMNYMTAHPSTVYADTAKLGEDDSAEDLEGWYDNVRQANLQQRSGSNIYDNRANMALYAIPANLQAVMATFVKGEDYLVNGTDDEEESEREDV